MERRRFKFDEETGEPIGNDALFKVLMFSIALCVLSVLCFVIYSQTESDVSLLFAIGSFFLSAFIFKLIKAFR